MLLNGTSSRAETSGLGGVTASSSGAITLATICNRASTSGFRTVQSLLTSGGSTVLCLGSNGTTLLFESNTDTENGPAIATGWQYNGMDKASGTSTPRFHVQNYASASVVAHTNGASTFNPGSLTPAKLSIGTFDSASDWFSGDVTVAAIWNRQLADWEHEWLARDLNAWHLLAPDWLVFGNLATIGSTIVDSSSNGGAPLTTLTNLATMSTACPVSYGVPDGDVTVDSPAGYVGPTLVATTDQEPASSNNGLAQQYQRSAFTAYGREWQFYADDPSGGVELMMTSSDDGGATWESPASQRTLGGSYVGGMRGVDVHFDGTYVHLVVGTSVFGGGDLVYARGLPDSGGSITWDSDQVVDSSGDPLWEVSINTDTNGYPWVAWEHWVGSDATPRVSGSTTKNGTWTARAGHPLDLSDTLTAPNVDLCWTHIAPLNYSGHMICFFWYEADVYCRVWNGSSWAAYEGPFDTPSHELASETIAFVTDTYNGRAYMAWTSDTNGTYLAIRSSGGSWSQEQFTADDSRTLALAFDDVDSSVHLAYVLESATDEVRYAIRDSGGSWNDIGVIADASGAGSLIPISLQITERARDNELVFSYQVAVGGVDDEIYAIVYPTAPGDPPEPPVSTTKKLTLLGVG